MSTRSFKTRIRFHPILEAGRRHPRFERDRVYNEHIKQVVSTGPGQHRELKLFHGHGRVQPLLLAPGQRPVDASLRLRGHGVDEEVGVLGVVPVEQVLADEG